ncbi:restriction endonuclease subunit S [Micromonospora sp. NPDC050200]|uniref:restriction endonuclease subunit S n=1 Tax=Micromonospora sp. NPDC050200 TaxID=3155664 RepID=UPI0033E78B93
MSERRTFKISDVTVCHDARRVPVRGVDRKPGKFPYYGASGIVDYIDSYLFDGEFLLVSEDGENLRTRKTPVAFMASGKFWVNNHAHILEGNDLCDTRYLCYVLSKTDVSGYLSGSTQPKLTQASLNSIQVELPRRSDQESIVKLLAAIDDKIGVNERIAETSCELALCLFAEERWSSRTSLSSLCRLRKVQVAPSTLDARAVAHHSLPAFDNGQVPDVCSPDKVLSTKFLIDEPSVLLSKLNPDIPRVWRVEPKAGVPALASTEFLVLVPNPTITTAELWAAARQDEFLSRLAARVTGTSKSHQRVRPDEVLLSDVVDPRATNVVTRQQVSSLVERAEQARQEGIALAQLRDVLLPKLISGALRIKDAELLVSAAV